MKQVQEEQFGRMLATLNLSDGHVSAYTMPKFTELYTRICDFYCIYIYIYKKGYSHITTYHNKSTNSLRVP